jgi:myo-inositol-1(or 4)-monophosphatase
MANEQEQNNTYVIGSKSFTAVAVNIASKAGEWIQSKVGNHQSITQKQSVQDLVTEVDKGAEALIRKLIHTYFPSHEVLGEEGVEPGPEASRQALEAVKDADYLWIVDPIDGTTNFIHGFPFFSVSIALAHKGDIIVGVVYDPSKDEMFVAEKGKGAYVHGKRMVVAPESKLSDSLVATGFPADQKAALPRNLKTMANVAPKVRNIRSGGSAALHLAYVAAGRLSGYWEMGLSAWDIAAGALLVQEAGGQITDYQGNGYHLGVRDILATNGAIHLELKEYL